MRPLQLGGKLGCFLIQLPPSYDYNPENLEEFFQKLDPQFRFAVEFRHLSWMREETWQLLSKYKVAYANVDEPLSSKSVSRFDEFWTACLTKMKGHRKRSSNRSFSSS
jgi:uncharacterized protein YecE (DUF72 family)